MRDWQSQSHVRWYCRYHVVFVPKYRKKVIFGQLRRGIGKILRELCEQHGVGWWRVMRWGITFTGEATELHGVPLLGAGLLREHSRPGRGSDPCVHPESGGRGEAPGAPASRGA